MVINAIEVGCVFQVSTTFLVIVLDKRKSPKLFLKVYLYFFQNFDLYIVTALKSSKFVPSSKFKIIGIRLTTYILLSICLLVLSQPSKLYHKLFKRSACNTYIHSS